MDYKASRILSAATMAYGVYAAVKPRHLAENMQATGDRVETYDKLAYGYAVRDIPMSLAGIFGPRKAVEAVMRGRIAADLIDAASLGTAAPNDGVRKKVLGVTIGWATLNVLALAWDRRRANA